MKKIVSLAFTLMLGCFMLTGCSDKAEPFTQKEYTADPGEITGINIDVRDRQIQVALSQDDQIRISYYENSKEAYDIGVSDGNILTMTSADNKEWTDYIGGKPSDENRKIKLLIPDALLDTLTLSTTNEDISLPSLTVSGSISLSSNGGNIDFESLGVGSDLTLNVKNGNISGTVAGSYEEFAIWSESKKGESNLPGNKDTGEKTLNVTSNNGDVNIDFTGAD